MPRRQMSNEPLNSFEAHLRPLNKSRRVLGPSPGTEPSIRVGKWATVARGRLTAGPFGTTIGETAKGARQWVIDF